MPAKIKRDWWKKKWPPLGDQSSGSNYDTVYKALKNYEHACRGKSIADRIQALDEIEDVIFPTINALKDEFTLPVTRKAVNNTLKDLASAVTSERSKLEKDGDREVEVWSRNFKQAVKSIGRLTALKKVEAGRYGLSLSLPVAVMRELENGGADGRLMAELDTVFDEKIKKIDAAVAKAAMKNGGIVVHGDVFPYFSQGFQEMQYEVERIPGRVLTQVAKNKRFARKYKRTKGVRIAKSSVDVAISAASFAVPGEQALAILGVVRATADLSKEIVTLCMTIERKHKILEWELKQLKKSYEKTRTSKEIGKQLLNSLVGTDVIASTKKVVDDFKEFRGAIALVSVRMSKKQLALKSLSKEIPRLDAELALVSGTVFELTVDSMSALSKRLKTSQAVLDNATKQFEKLKAQVDKDFGRLRKAEKALPILKKAVQQLQAGQSDTLDMALEKVDQTVQALFFAASFTDITVGSKAAQSYAMLAVSDWKSIADDLKGLKKYKTK